MNRGPFIFIGVLIIVSLSWAFTLVKPMMESEIRAPFVGTEVRVPPMMTGLAAQGREVYREQGCVHCHTQQIRVISGMDVERGWGERMTVALDYLDQSPAFTGTSRIGPDLSNVGERRPDEEWHLLHLYNPRITSPGSNMPAFDFLFETREIIGERSNKALDLPVEYAPPEGYVVIPTPQAQALAAYMTSLRLDYEIEEAPAPEKINFVSE